MSPSSNLSNDYALLKRLASTAEAGGLSKERSVLLLWFLRNVIGLDDLEAYEYVCDGDRDGGVDGLYLERFSGDDDYDTLVIYQSKYTQSPHQVGRTSFNGFLATANHFKSEVGLAQFLSGDIEPKLRALIKKFNLRRKLRDGHYEDGRLRVRTVLVTTGMLNSGAKTLVDATNASEGAGYLRVYDIRDLGPLARSVAAPTPPPITIDVPCAPNERMTLGTAPNRVAMVAVKAQDIVAWPGIADRSLFELNVRRELKLNQVRRELDAAIRRHHEHKDFLAYHNGMTVTCVSFNEEPDKLVVERPSVVNGTQSTIAFARADEDGELTPDLRVFVKIVEVAERTQLANQVSRRSNTQTAVNRRNLVALTGPQVRIKREFEAQYPSVTYEIRPDATVQETAGDEVIANDDAAQLLCAIFNAMPWLAVKRLSLFTSENHAMIFNEDIHAAHVLLADIIRRRVDERRELFPERYRGSWRLTRLVAVYLVGQILRSDETLNEFLEDPASALQDRAHFEAQLELPISIVAGTLRQRQEDKDANEEEEDDFNVDFKNGTVLRQLRGEARRNFALFNTVGRMPSNP